MWTSTRTAATALDGNDELADLRARYDLPPGMVYLDGSIGGPLPRTTPTKSRKFVEHYWDGGTARTRPSNAWRTDARVAAGTLAPLVGADPDEITVAESTSMNLFRMLLAAARLRPDRAVLAVVRDCFATDRYLARSAADFAGCELILLDSTEDLARVLDDRVAVVALSHTDVVSGAVRDAVAITAEVHRWGALTLWDLSHSAGALRVDLHEWDTDLAIGCGYKYLGGGSGAPAYTFVAQRHQADLAERGRLACGSAGVLNPLTTGSVSPLSSSSLSQLHSGLSILDGVSPAALEAKTAGLVELFLHQVHERCAGTGIEVVPAASPHGTQVSLRHRHAQYLVQGLFARGIVADFVEPDTLRFSFAPSWLRYVDVWEAVEALHQVLDGIHH